MEGIEIAATTPIMARVIRTSANVKALEFLPTPPRGFR